MRRRLLIAALLLGMLSGCGAQAADSTPQNASAVPSAGESFAEGEPGGTEALAARPGVSATAKATSAPPAGSAGQAPTATFATTSSTFTFTRAGRTLRTVVW